MTQSDTDFIEHCDRMIEFSRKHKDKSFLDSSNINLPRLIALAKRGVELEVLLDEFEALGIIVNWRGKDD